MFSYVFLKFCLYMCMSGCQIDFGSSVSFLICHLLCSYRQLCPCFPVFQRVVEFGCRTSRFASRTSQFGSRTSRFRSRTSRFGSRVSRFGSPSEEKNTRNFLSLFFYYFVQLMNKNIETCKEILDPEPIYLFILSISSFRLFKK